MDPILFEEYIENNGKGIYGFHTNYYPIKSGITAKTYDPIESKKRRYIEKGAQRKE